ncbi:sigma-70 family RNA polymerase sigma factor [Paraburkholderia sp. BCC1886]|uniref:sigma-70 family RNA polymerase sigma factor n=1 Tax=Paraburkholderia sp. BCC1886 TaxID=2562670 RepID=UPI0011837815|nr:sigma-70 family RNA polymerase sigma factor [Paraburkholderia sp. BCC1886]
MDNRTTAYLRDDAQWAADTGRRDFLSEEFRRSYEWLLNRVWRKVGCSFDAEDIASATFVEIAELSDTASVREPRALLTTISQRIMTDLWRRRSLERNYLASLAASPEPSTISAENLCEIIQSLVTIDSVLANLSPKAREAFLLSQLDELTYAEIAQRLSVSASMVRKYMAQALTACYMAVAA